MNNFLGRLKIRFPRLQGVSFTGSGKDEYTVASTPAGPVETVYFYERADFEHAVIALAYKNEPHELPPSMGAVFISGLIDHLSNEKVAIIILSRGGYSGISCRMLKDAITRGKYSHMDIEGVRPEASADIPEGITEDRWETLSLTIRKYHEMAHFVQRKLFPDNKDAIKDEIKADMVGIVEAFGVYDGFLARLFLGIEGSEYRQGGRLENYVSDKSDIDAACDFSENYISQLEGQISAGYKICTGFDILMAVEEKEKNGRL